MCEKAFAGVSWTLDFNLDQYKTQEMCNKAIEEYICYLEYVSDVHKTQQIHSEAVEEQLEAVEFIPDEDSYTLKYVSDLRAKRCAKKLLKRGLGSRDVENNFRKGSIHAA